MRHLLTLLDLAPDEVKTLLQEAAALKAAGLRGERPGLLHGRVLGMVFEKPSLRTRVSFQAGMAQLGGSSVFMTGGEVGIGKRESLADCARTLSQYVDAVVLRVFRHETVAEFAKYATIPVINGLSDSDHPCQALGDLLTVEETCGEIAGKTVVFVGDGNNVARSLAVGCAMLGARFMLAAPDGYGFDEPFLQTVRRTLPRGEILVNGRPEHTIPTADIIYTDVWTSMGQEAEADERRAKFAPYQVNETLLTLAPAHVRVMHCLPAHRGEEITDAVLDSGASVVFQQAGNRMHAQKALLKWLLT